MKVFISWSGDLSKGVAEILKSWLKCVLQATEPFLSTEDIEKGSLWFNDLNDQLKDTQLGIICLTRDNHVALWILFEAGALAKGLNTNRVCTLLIDLRPSDLKPPLSQFNATRPTKEDMRKLVETINAAMGVKALRAETLGVVFDKFWGDFKDKFDSALKGYAASPRVPLRSIEDMVREILETVRSVEKQAYLLSGGPKTAGSVLDSYALQFADRPEFAENIKQRMNLVMKILEEQERANPP